MRSVWARATSMFALLVAPPVVVPAFAADIPIDVVVDPQADALHAWHLYRHEDDSPVVGDRIAFVGQFHADERSVVLRQPPWLIVSPEPGAERSRSVQVFALAVAAVPDGLDADGFARVEGVLVADEDASADGPRGRRDLPRYRLDEATAEPIRLARRLAALEAEAPRVVEREEKWLRAICAEHGLDYEFAAEPLGMSWHDGRIAFTARLSRHPGFSFKPVPYATVSVLFDPATGSADRLVVTRRLWADPPD